MELYYQLENKSILSINEEMQNENDYFIDVNNEDALYAKFQNENIEVSEEISEIIHQIFESNNSIGESHQKVNNFKIKHWVSNRSFGELIDMYDNKDNNDTLELKNKRQKFLEQLMKTYHYPNMNYIKPGVNEATRVMLRRYPEKLFIQDMDDSNVQHLVQLANEKNIEIEVVPDVPYRAIALIKAVVLHN